MFTVRFWNRQNENIKVNGKYVHIYNTRQDAWKAANFMVISAYKKDAVSMDINEEFYSILSDKEEEEDEKI